MGLIGFLIVVSFVFALLGDVKWMVAGNVRRGRAGRGVKMEDGECVKETGGMIGGGARTGGIPRLHFISYSRTFLCLFFLLLLDVIPLLRILRFGWKGMRYHFLTHHYVIDTLDKGRTGCGTWDGWDWTGNMEWNTERRNWR